MKIPVFFLLVLLQTSCSSAQRGKTASPKQVVVTYRPIATQTGYQILNQGGNAFVAATAVEYVLGEGTTSLGGPLGALLYDAKTRNSVYLDAGFNQPVDSMQKWNPKTHQAGKAAIG